MSCGDIWTMMRHGREKGGVFGEINKMVIFREKRFFSKRDFLPFSTNIYFREKRFKRDFLQRPIYGKKI